MKPRISPVYVRPECRKSDNDPRLAAILAADGAGYSRLMWADEGGTLWRLQAIQSELVDPTIAAHHGRLAGVVTRLALVA
jgi:class 3 adenylate cyclase